LRKRFTMRRLALALLALLAPLVGATCPPATCSLRVYYAGPAGPVQQALDLADELELVAAPESADVLVLNSVIPEPQRLAAALERGAGLLLIPGPALPASDLRLLLGEPIVCGRRGDALTLAQAQGDPVFGQIPWTSAPQVRERALCAGLAGWQVLVVGLDGESVLATRERGVRRLYLLTPYLDGYNPQLQEWPYFSYLIYALAVTAGGRDPASFAEYPGSPVPHGRERGLLLGILGMAAASFALLFLAVRRYSLAHPELLDALVRDPSSFRRREVSTGWEEIGFQRPLAGFLFAFTYGIVLFVPAIVYRNLVLPAYILPSAQTLGIWGQVTQFFNLIWVFFDMGTSSAFIKFFAQYRVHDVRRAVQYGQVYVWWQALSGSLQVCAMAFLGATVLPRTAYALYAWAVIVHALIQLPGFYQVMRHALTALQRFDYAQVLDLGLALVFPMVTQPLLVTLLLAWGSAQPALGRVTGGLFGLGLAAYASELLTFLLGLILFSRLGFRSRLLFLAHFDGRTLWEALRFGLFEMLGSLLWMVGQAAEVLITQARLHNYAEVWGNWALAQNFVYAYQVINTLYKNLLSSISEAFSHGRTVLARYYAAMAYKWGGLTSGFLGAVLLAVADRFSRGIGLPEFARAALFAAPLIVWGAAQFPSWVSDNVQLASNRPYLRALMIGLEQMIRIVLAWLLIGRFQVWALVIAYFAGLLTKDILAYWVNYRLCFPQRFYVWPTLVAPLLAGAVHYALLRWLGGVFWREGPVGSILLLFLSLVPSLPVFAFLYAFFGGWDDGTLEELRAAVALSGALRGPAYLFWWGSAWGARLSPLHGRFPAELREAALAEARALTRERVSLA